MKTYEIQDGMGQAPYGYAPDEMRTGERTGAAKLKWVVIVDQSLSPGQAVNAAVCVSAATAPAVPGLLGSGGPDAADIWHPGARSRASHGSTGPRLPSSPGRSARPAR